MCGTCGCKSAETLSKTSCCCGADEANPCACMKAPEPMECSAKAPKCACYKALEKNAEYDEEDMVSCMIMGGMVRSYLIHYTKR